MQGSRTAKGDEHVVARIAAPLGRDELDRAHDVVLGHPHRVVRDLLHTSAQLLRERGEGVAGERGIDVHAPAEEGVGEHGAADQVRVGDRGVRAAPPVAGGAGFRTGGAGADAHHAAVVAPHD